MRSERSLVIVASIVASVCLLPIIIFVLTSLWPQRVLASWLFLGLAVLTTLVLLTLRVIKATTSAKVRLAEEKHRSRRLYANERLVEHEGRYGDEWMAQQQRAMMEEPYAQRPYVHTPHRHMPDPYEANTVSYSGLKPLSIDNYDWDE